MSAPPRPALTIAQSVSMACVLEATAHKPGNVHRGADFDDMTYLDLIGSAIAIGPALESAATTGVGVAIRRAIDATQSVVGKNTNLGIVLLLGPLAAAAQHADLRQEVAACLDRLTAQDACEVYAAIQLANPGGMGRAPVADIHDAPPTDLLAAMQLAEDRDLVARQYANGFHEVFHFVLPAIEKTLQLRGSLLDAIVAAHVETMAEYPDSLMARKCGLQVAQEAGIRARRALDAGNYGDDAYHAELAELDFWLRADGNQRNPGTTADLVAAAVFVGLREGRLHCSMQ